MQPSGDSARLPSYQRFQPLPVLPPFQPRKRRRSRRRRRSRSRRRSRRMQTVGRRWKWHDCRFHCLFGEDAQYSECVRLFGGRSRRGGRRGAVVEAHAASSTFFLRTPPVTRMCTAPLPPPRVRVTLRSGYTPSDTLRCVCARTHGGVCICVCVIHFFIIHRRTTHRHLNRHKHMNYTVKCSIPLYL